MNRKISIILIAVMVIVSILTLAACGGNNSQVNKRVSSEDKKIIEESIEAIKAEWNRVFTEDNQENKVIKIANTIVHKMKHDVTPEFLKKELGDEYRDSFYDNYKSMFGDVDYIVEFVILTDYLVENGYVLDIGIHNNCLVKGDKYEVDSRVLEHFGSVYFLYKFPFIEKTIDYGSAFDRTIDVSK